MLNTILGKKLTQSQKFLEDGTRIPVTMIWAGENYVVAREKGRITLGFGTKKHVAAAIGGILKKAGIGKNLRFFREIEADGENGVKIGTIVSPSDVVKPGDTVQVVGISKGKGFAGGVKRHHFKGGPRTHGQSDRERAPGSIGQTTTPGRVYKGKRMAGRMGNERVTVKNLTVFDVSGEMVTMSGLVPGGRNNLLIITKIGEMKKFVPLHKGENAEKAEAGGETESEAIQEVKAETAERKEESKEAENAS